MKVILLQNVPKIGQKGDVKDLKEGYVRNMLLPNGLAKIATQGELNNLEKMAKKNEEYHNLVLSKVSDIFKKVEGQVVELKENTNEKGHLFAKVDKSEVISAVKKSLGFDLKEEWFDLDPIKEVGEYEIDLKFEKLHKKMTVKVIPA